MKKNISIFSFVITIIFFTLIACAQPEQHISGIVTHIIHTKSAIETYLAQHQSNAKPIFVSFWDFDGTILKGDCSEGYQENTTHIYKGLVQLAIEHNLSKFYKPTEYSKFNNYYQHLDTTQGHLAAYTYLTKIFAGQSEQSMIALSTQYFNTTLQHYYFVSSIAIMAKLKENNIGIYIISASPQFFVKGAAPSLNLHPDNIHGIQLKTKAGMLTSTVVHPIPYAQGKTAKLKEIISMLKKSNNTPHVYALAAFGNSYHTDGHFLQYVATQTLPAGKPIAVMINGGSPPALYAGLFQCVSQNQVTGDSKSKITSCK